jgi:hypothetical protein
MNGDWDVKEAVNRATNNRALRGVARGGYAINGVLHLLMAYLIVLIASGSKAEADQSGALETLAARGGGVLSLWVVAAGLFALASWRLAETVLGLHPGEHSRAHARRSSMTNRLRALGLALMYSALAFTAVEFALGAGRRSSRQTMGLSAELMQSYGGKTILVAVGSAIVVVGVYYMYKGISRKFLNDLRYPGGPVLTTLGVFGHFAEGLVLAAAGSLVIAATVTSDPAKATGLDSAVKGLGQAQFGQPMLVAAACGFAAYGLYSFALTRYARM